MSKSDYSKSTQKTSAAMDTFTQSQKLRQGIEIIMRSPWSTWEQYKLLVPVFQDGYKAISFLHGINSAIAVGRSPQTAPRLRERLNDFIRLALRERVASGRTDLGPVGLMLGAEDKSPGMDVHEFGTYPNTMTALVNKLYIGTGTDIVVIGLRKVGKTNLMNNYMAVPWMAAYGQPVVSSVPILNADDFGGLFKTFPYKSETLMEICKIRLNDIKKGTRTPVMMINDESGLLAGRTRTTASIVINQIYFAYISRHFRLTTIWSYQLPQDVPYKIMDLATEFIYIDSHKSMRRVIKDTVRGELVQKFTGLRGWEKLKKDAVKAKEPMAYIQYEDEVPSTSMWDVDVIALMGEVNNQMNNLYSKDKKREAVFYTSVYKYLKENSDSGPKLPLTKMQFVKAAALFYLLANDGLDTEGNVVAKTMKLTQGNIARFLEPVGITAPALGQMVAAVKRNPEMFMAGLTVSDEEEDLMLKEADKLGIYNQLVKDGEERAVEG